MERGRELAMVTLGVVLKKHATSAIAKAAA
jgi:hypothetical protein